MLNKDFEPVINTMEHWGDEFLRLIPHIVIALIVLVVFWLLGKKMKKKIKPTLEQLSASSHSSKMLVNIGSQLIFLGMLLIGTVIAASILGLDKIFASALTGLGVFGLALGYALKDIAANFFAGIVIGLREPFKTGDLVKVGEFHGYIVATDLLYTTIRTTDGQLIFSPNQSIYSQPLVNYSSEGERRIVLNTGVSYGDDLELVREIATETIKSFEFLKADKPIDLYFTNIGGSSYNFDLRYWIQFDTQTQFRHALSEGIIKLKKAFDDANISIPFPVQTMDFGSKGGVNLSDNTIRIKNENNTN